MTQTRIQVPEFGNTAQLKPAPLPSDTFAAAAQASIDRRFEATAAALSFFSSAVGQIGSIASSVAPLVQQNNTWAEERRIHGMTNDEIKAQVRAGNIPSYADPFANTAAGKLLGQRYGEAAAAEFTQHMQTEFDWNTGDPNAEATKWLNAELEKYGDNPIMGQQIAAAFGSAREQVTQFGINRMNEQATEQRTDAAYLGMEGFLKHAVINGSDPAQTADILFSTYPVMGTEGTLGVDNKALDAQLLTNAARIASTNPEYAAAIINAKGPSGMSFAENPQYMAKVDLINADIQRATWNQEHALAVADLNGNNLQTLLNGGSLNDLRPFVYTDINGAQQTITPDQQRETAMVNYGQLSDMRARNYNETPQEQIIHDTVQLGKAGQLNPRLSETLNGIAMQATPGTQMDPEAETQLVERLKTAVAVSAQNPLILQTHVKDAKDRDFIEAFQIGVGTLQMNDSEAIQFAGQVVNSGNVSLSPQAVADLDKEVAAYDFTDWDWLWENDPEQRYELGNTYAIEQRIGGVAKALVAANGMSPAKAVQLAGEMTRKTFMPYRGQVLDLGGMNAPGNVRDALNAYLNSFAAENPVTMSERGLAPQDLTVIQRGSNFFIVNKDDFSFVPLDWSEANGSQGGKPRVLSLEDLRSWSQWRANTLANNAAASAASEANNPAADWTTYNHGRQADIDTDAVAKGYSRSANGLYQDTLGNIVRPRAGILGPIVWQPGNW
ncbi:hypothetical protein [Devosia sp. SL43]|uniref:hypothetical protein n=1 Tax=Devosia sp. SL43 TaxID=2806348 RepID=UPI001F1FD0E4|nr:hypothetical protein [Devosia sp. SL43]UJW85099.1 hypothetical protein IM737_17070 [Devosia sp. SL43]